MTTSYRSRVIGDCSVEDMGRNMWFGCRVNKLAPTALPALDAVGSGVDGGREHLVACVREGEI